MIGSTIVGIIGFLRILKYCEKDYVTKNNNYIEFDIQNLKDFSKDYFKYFTDKYNIAERLEERMEKSFSKINRYIEEETKSEKKEEQKKYQEQRKNEIKYIKQAIKKQIDKIKKIDETTYQNILEEYNKLDKIKTKEDTKQLEEIQNKIGEEIEKDYINKKLTLNLFKSILSNEYYGQPSFLNVVKTSLTYEEQEKLMYKDYISNIIEIDYLKEIAQGKYKKEEIQENIKEKLEDEQINKEIKQIYKNILNKYIQKDKELSEIQKYIEETIFSECSMCENQTINLGNYSESNFIPLAVSSDNMKNFFWNQNVKFPICDICKLILFCIPAGISRSTKIEKDSNLEYKEKEIYSFINDDVNVEELLKINNYFSLISRQNKNRNDILSDLILNIIEEKKKLSEWELENILIVEFEAEYLSYSRIEYFNIKRYIAIFFRDYSQKTIQNINDYKFKIQMMNNILKNQETKNLINEKIKEELKKETLNGYNTQIATITRNTINYLKKEENEMEQKIKKSNEKLYVLYKLGISIHETLKEKNEENKLNGYVYKMLNSIKSGNKQEFMDTVIRIHISLDKEISPIFLEVMQENGLDFESIGHSFVSGLISSKYEKQTDKIEEN